MSSANDLIRQSQTCPPKPIIDGLFNESEIAGLHGPPEVFKTTFSLQLAESIASGEMFLGEWRIPRPCEVYFLETEMSVPALGTRLGKIFTGRTPPSRLHLADDEQLRAFRRAGNLVNKFALLREWLTESKSEVVMLDTCNPFFRGNQSANHETVAGEFFDLLAALPAPTRLFVRHNHKPKMEDIDGDGAAKIRGSGQFADVPDLLMELQRPDKRTNEATFRLSKFRNGSKPDDLTLWFDAGMFRLISIPPVIHLLLDGPKTRTDLLEALHRRFNASQSSGDAMISQCSPYLVSRTRGHNKEFRINWEAASEAEWFKRLPAIGRGEVMQGCISSSLSLRPQSQTDSASSEGKAT